MWHYQTVITWHYQTAIYCFVCLYSGPWYTSYTNRQIDNKILNCRLFNTLRPWKNGRHFPDEIFKLIFLKENDCINFDSLRFVPKGPINKIPSLVQTVAWSRPGDKPLSQSMMVSSLTHIHVCALGLNGSKCYTRYRFVTFENTFLEARAHLRFFFFLNIILKGNYISSNSIFCHEIDIHEYTFKSVHFVTIELWWMDKSHLISLIQAI